MCLHLDVDACDFERHTGRKNSIGRKFVSDNFRFSQVFLPLYIIDTIGTLNRIYVAIAPLCSYVSGLLASFPMRAINKRMGRKLTMIIGLGFVMSSAVLFWFLHEHTGSLQIEVMLIAACVLLGIGTSTTSICSFSLTSDLIGLNTECGAFVYGIMSFADKMANGITIAVLQQFNPCSSTDSSTSCREYYRDILTFIPAGVSALTIIMTLTIWKKTIGGNRHEMLPICSDNESETRRLLNAETHERKSWKINVWGCVLSVCACVFSFCLLPFVFFMASHSE